MILLICLLLRINVLADASRVDHPVRHDLLRNHDHRSIPHHLQRLNKPVLRSIKSPDGDFIDCVRVSQQPAFDHPLLLNHTFQVRPMNVIKNDLTDGRRNNGARSRRQPQQLWQKVDVRCPAGTIPLRRNKHEDILRATQLEGLVEHYGRKFHSSRLDAATLNLDSSRKSHYNSSNVLQSAIDESGHQHAIAYVKGDTYHGAKATLNVWRPTVGGISEFSLSQMWILGGSYANNNLNSIEVGWHVSPGLYGDNNTRLFVYWTRDGYETTGCYNLLCGGFVQVSKDVVLGASISPVSSYGGPQYDIDILVWKDATTGNWWLQFGDKHLVGYWPAELFTSLAASASMVQWGGEVLVTSSSAGAQMGSGRLPDEGFGRAAYVSHLLLVDSRNTLHYPPSSSFSIFTDRPECYNALPPSFDSTQSWGPHFFFGGPAKTCFS